MLVDGNVVGTFKPAVSYQIYTTTAFTVTAGTPRHRPSTASTPPAATTPPSSTPSRSSSGPARRRIRRQRRPPRGGDSGFETVQVGAGKSAYDPAGLGLDLHRPPARHRRTATARGSPPATPRPRGHAGRLPPGTGLDSRSRWPAGPPALHDLLRCGPARQLRRLGRGLRGAGRRQRRRHLQAHRHLVPVVHHRTSPSAGAPTIEFLGLDTAGGDNTAFLDAVAVATGHPATPRWATRGSNRPGRGRKSPTTRLARPGPSQPARPGLPTARASPRATPPRPRARRSPSSRARPDHAVGGRLGRRHATRSPSTRPSAATAGVSVAGLRGAGRRQRRRHLQAHRHLVPALHHCTSPSPPGRTPSSSSAWTPQAATTPPSSTPSPSPVRRSDRPPLWATRIPQRPPCGFWGGHARRTAFTLALLRVDGRHLAR